MLARLLQHSPAATSDQLSVTIFENESSLDYRSQGGTLDLPAATGLAAMQAAGLCDEFQRYARYDGEALKVCDKRLLCYLNMGGASKLATGKPTKPGAGVRPEIDRPILRKVLHDSLNPGTVVWNSKLVRVSSSSSSSSSDRPILHFADGRTEGNFDLIVSADGAWSRVRPYLSSATPFYTGVGGTGFTIPDGEANTPELYKLANRGGIFAFSDAKSITAQYMGEGSLSTYTWSVRPEDWQRRKEYTGGGGGGGDANDPEVAKQAVRREFHDWDEKITGFALRAEGAVAPRSLYTLPIGHRWTHRRGVTLIGDSAHLMSPFAGEGLNLALADALGLGKAIIAAVDEATGKTEGRDEGIEETLDVHVRGLEEEMFVRSERTQQVTKDLMDLMFFTEGAPRTTIERWMLRAAGDELGYWVTLVVTPIVYAYVFFFKLLW